MQICFGNQNGFFVVVSFQVLFILKVKSLFNFIEKTNEIFHLKHMCKNINLNSHSIL